MTTHGVGAAELFQQPRLGGGAATRRAAARRRLRSPGTAPPRRSRCCRACVLGTVVEHRGSSGRSLPASDAPAPPGRGGDRRREPEAGHQHGVAQEGVQLAQVMSTPPWGQVDVGLQRGAGRDRGALGQSGTGGLLSADQYGRYPAGDHRVDSALPGAVAAENPITTIDASCQQVGQFQVRQPRGIRPPVVLARWTGR